MSKRNSWEEKWIKAQEEPLGEGGQGIVYIVEDRETVKMIREEAHNVLGYRGEYTEKAFDNFRGFINSIVLMDLEKHKGALKYIKDNPYGNDKQKAEDRFKWENGYVESFNSKIRDELLNRELFLHIDELRYVADRWRMDYNHYRPHSSLGYMAPAAFSATCIEQGSATLRLAQDKENMCGTLS